MLQQEGLARGSIGPKTTRGCGHWYIARCMYTINETGDGFGLWMERIDRYTNTRVKSVTVCGRTYLHTHVGLKGDRLREICIYSCVRLINEQLNMEVDRQIEMYIDM